MARADLGMKIPYGMSARNAAWMMLGQGSSVLVQTAYFILLARLLGSMEYGIYAGAFALVSIVSQYATLGSGVVFIRYVSPDLKRFAPYWGNILAATVVSGTTIICGLAWLGHWFVGPGSAAILVIVAIGDCFFRRLTESAAQVFQAFEKLRYTAMLNLSTSLLRLSAVTTLILVIHHSTARMWAITAASVSFCSVIASIVLISRNMGRPAFDPSLFRRHGLEGFGFAVACSTGSIYNDVDKTMLSHYGMTAANGIYTMAYRMVDIFAIPITSIQGAMLPRFFREGKAGGVARSYGLARRIVGKTFLCGILAALGMFLCSPLIPWIVGKSFAPSVSAVRWLCLIPLFRSLHLSAGDGLLAAGYQRVRFSLQLAAAIGNYSANLFLIPRYSWQGAAWSSLATDGLLGVASWVILSWLKNRAGRKHDAASEMAGHLGMDAAACGDSGGLADAT